MTKVVNVLQNWNIPIYNIIIPYYVKFVNTVLQKKNQKNTLAHFSSLLANYLLFAILFIYFPKPLFFRKKVGMSSSFELLSLLEEEDEVAVLFLFFHASATMLS